MNEKTTFVIITSAAITAVQILILVAVSSHVYHKDKVQHEKIIGEVMTSFAQLMVERQQSIENRCFSYMTAIYGAFPSYQRRKVDQNLSKLDLPLLSEEYSVPSLEPVPEAGSSDLNLYEVIRDEVELKGRSIPPEELEDTLKDIKAYGED